MSDTKGLAKKIRLNANSPTTQHLLQNREMKVVDFIGKFRRGNIKAVFPSEFLKKTIEDALKSRDTTVRKLLTDSEYFK